MEVLYGCRGAVIASAKWIPGPVKAQRLSRYASARTRSVGRYYGSGLPAKKKPGARPGEEGVWNRSLLRVGLSRRAELVHRVGARPELR